MKLPSWKVEENEGEGEGAHGRKEAWPAEEKAGGAEERGKEKGKERG